MLANKLLKSVPSDWAYIHVHIHKQLCNKLFIFLSRDAQPSVTTEAVTYQNKLELDPINNASIRQGLAAMTEDLKAPRQ